MAKSAQKKNWFAIWVSVAVVVVLVGVGVLVVALNNQASAPGEAPESSIIDVESGAISVGDGADSVAIFVDFMCPFCKQFEDTEGSVIDGLVEDGSITLDIHPLGLLDRASQGTEFSSRSASAMYSVAVNDPDNVLPFLQAMYANQPAEGTPGLTNEEIIEVARQAGVNVAAELEADITSGRYVKFVQAQTLPEGAQGTPTLMINGELVPVTFDPQVDIVQNLAR